MSDSGQCQGAGGQPSGGGGDTAMQRVMKAFTAWDDTFDSGNATALAAFYTDNAYVLPPTHQSVTGKTAIETFFAAQFAAGVTGHVLAPFDIDDLGSTLIVSSNWSAKARDGNGQPISVGGLATHVLVQQADGSLKLRIHIFN